MDVRFTDDWTFKLTKWGKSGQIGDQELTADEFRAAFSNDTLDYVKAAADSKVRHKKSAGETIVTEPETLEPETPVVPDDLTND